MVLFGQESQSHFIVVCEKC